MSGRGRRPKRPAPVPSRPGDGGGTPLLWVSNAPWSTTGYGVQTALFTQRIKRLGFDPSIFAYFGLEGAPLDWDGIKVLPRYSHPYGNDIVSAHFARTGGFVLALCDVWVLAPEVYASFPCAAWAPVDHDPIQPPTLRWFQSTKAIPIAMSRFGETQYREAGLDPLYVPHGVDTHALFPMPQPVARQSLGLPEDAFIVGMVAANKGVAPPRKAFSETLLAFRAFAQTRPDALLYLHTDKAGVFGGVNLEELVKTLGLLRQVVFCDQYQQSIAFPPGYMAAAFSAMDVLVNPSYGEGFGVPIIEAQSCGVPVIVGDNTAMPELVGAGWRVPGEPYWTTLGSFQFRPDVDAIVAALEGAYASRGDVEMRQQAREFALGYDADHITATYWKPTLAAITERLGL